MLHVREPLRSRRNDRAETEPRERHTEERPHARKNQALGQEEANHSLRARAEREPDGDLFLPRGRADEEQSRDVGASDQEDEANGPLQHAQDASQVSEERTVERLNTNAAPFLWTGIFPLESGSNALDVFLRALDGHAHLHCPTIVRTRPGPRACT